MATATEIAEAGQRVRDEAAKLSIPLNEKQGHAKRLAAAALTPGEQAQSQDAVTDAAMRIRAEAASIGIPLDFVDAKKLASAAL